MESKPTQIRHTGLIQAFCCVLLILLGTNLILQYLYTDFWAQPVPLQNRLGVAGFEALMLFLFWCLLCIPAGLLVLFNFRKMAKLTLVLMCLPLFLFLLIAWSFYSHFERFVGSFAVQMLLQDGGQLINFVHKMPSSVNFNLLSSVVIAAVGAVAIVFTRASVMGKLRLALVPVAALTIVCSALSSMLWNQAEQVPDTNAVVVNNTWKRLKDAKYQLLVDRAGPFTEAARSFSVAFFKQEQSYAIDTDRLDRQHGKGALPDEKKINKYNVVFALVESLHPSVLQAYGGNEGVMPNVDALSQSAIVLKNAWAQASHSNYADIASLSGQYPLRTTNIHFYPKKPNYPKALPYDRLRPYGYKVGLFSSQNERWGLMENYLNSDSIDRFSHVGSGASGELNTYRGIKLNHYSDEKKSFSYGEFMYQESGSEIERSDGITTDEAIAWMETIDERTPVFLYFNFQASHSPFNALPENFQRKFLLGDSESIDKLKRGMTQGQPIENVVSAYKDALHYVDQNIGKVISYMQDTRRHDNTIYIISADTSIRFNGELFGNGGDLWPDVLNVPVLISYPGATSTTLIEEPVEQIDIMPTVLGMIGVGSHPASQGVDLLNTKRNPERIVYSVSQTPVAHQYAAIYKDWQLRHDFMSDQQTLHYAGAEVDVNRIQNLSEQEVNWLANKLRQWREAQLGYYASPEAHTLFYPPKFNSVSWSSGAVPAVSENDVE